MRNLLISTIKVISFDLARPNIGDYLDELAETNINEIVQELETNEKDDNDIAENHFNAYELLILHNYYDYFSFWTRILYTNLSISESLLFSKRYLYNSSDIKGEDNE